MIKEFKIHNYKSFQDGKFELSKLNLFSGANSAGKSSAIQALLNAADNIQESVKSHRFIARHTPSVTFNEVRNFITNAKSFDVNLSSDDQCINLNFTPCDDAFINIGVSQSDAADDNLYDLLHNNLFYLPATRTSRLSDSIINPNPDQNILGLNDEYIIDFYYNNRSNVLSAELVKDPSLKTLEGQVNYWLDKLTGYKLVVEMDGSQYKVKFETKSGKQLYPYHVGTGISFITGVLIVCLAMPANSLIIIENPEIHLHPAAQADLTDFLAMIALSGRQVLVESHSDHVFNGIRRLLHKHTLLVGDVSVYNFVRDNDGLSYGSSVSLSQEGGIVNYVPGMFEQFDKDLDEILN